MDILETIKTVYYETPNNDEEISNLNKQRDNLESQIVKSADESTRKLFRQFNALVDEIILYYTEHALEFSYNEVRHILKELVNFEIKER